MQIPQIGHLQFAILGALSQGAKTCQELRRLLEWRSKSHLTTANRPLLRWGLVSKRDELLRGGGKRRVYVITDAGRRAWREAADFYLKTIERFGRPEEQVDAGAGEVIATKEAPPEFERLPTPEEFERLSRHWHPRYVRACRVLWTLNRTAGRRVLSKVDLAKLTIADVDLARATLRVNGRQVRLNAECLVAVRESIGDRTEGWLFLTRRGCQLDPQCLAVLFRAAKRRAGLPDEVQIIGKGKFPAKAGTPERPGRVMRPGF